jgi:citrate synthase
MNDTNENAVGFMRNGEYVLRGKRLTDLIASSDFISAAWLAWTGRTPSPGEKKMLEACFIAGIDHGAEPPSAQAARIIASCGKPLADAVAAGVLAFGPRHGNAAGAASKWVRDAAACGATPADIVKKAVELKARIPGIGHPAYETDPRTVVLFGLAKEQLPETRHIDFISEVAAALSDEKKKPMPVNVDGAIGAIIADMGADSELADAVFLCARTIGLVAHTREESAGSPSYRRGKRDAGI